MCRNERINSCSDMINFPVLFRVEVSEYLLRVHEVRCREKTKTINRNSRGQIRNAPLTSIEM